MEYEFRPMDVVKNLLDSGKITLEKFFELAEMNNVEMMNELKRMIDEEKLCI